MQQMSLFKFYTATIKEYSLYTEPKSSELIDLFGLIL